MAAARILYYAPRSPPSRSVLLTARALNVDLSLKLIQNNKGENRTPEFLKMNPQHTIPMLVDNDVIVTDSHAICAYLSEKYGINDNLYPKNLAARALVDSRMHFDSGFLFGRMRFLIEPVLYFNSPQFMQDRIDYIRMTWEIVEAFLEQRPFIAGDQLTIADFCCAASITSITHLVPIDENVYPKFVDWLKRMRQLPYFDEVNAEGVAMLQTALKEKLLANQKAIEDANK